MRTREVVAVPAPLHRDTHRTKPDQPTKRDPSVLDRHQCLRLLGTKGVGRLILGARVPPWTIPVPYTVDGGRIVAEVPTEAVAERHWPALVTFEADHRDAATGGVWSVTVLGGCHVEPLAAPNEQSTAVVTIDPDLVTGRRFGARSTVDR